MNTANKLTLLRVILIPVYLLMWHLDFVGNNIVALVIFIAASITITSRSFCGIEMKVSSRTRAISSSLYFSHSCEINESEDSSNMFPSPVRSQRSDTLN